MNTQVIPSFGANSSVRHPVRLSRNVKLTSTQASQDIFFGAEKKSSQSFVRNIMAGLALLTAVSTTGCKKDSDDVTPKPPTEEPSDNKFKKILSNRPLEPNQQKKETFFREFYVQGSHFPPAGTAFASMTEEQGLQMLKQYALKAPAVNPQKVLDIYNNPVMKQKYPSPWLRVSMARMVKIPGGELLLKEFYINDPSVAGGKIGTTLNPNHIIEATLDEQGKVQFTVNELKGGGTENPALFTAGFFHEFVHGLTLVNGSLDNGFFEELGGKGLENWARQIDYINNPELFNGSTFMTQNNNIELQAFHNSGLEAKQGFRQSNGNRSVFPGSVFTDIQSLEDLLAKFTYKDMPRIPSDAPPILKRFYQEIGCNCPGEQYNDPELDCLENEMGRLSLEPNAANSPKKRVELSNQMGMPTTPQFA